MSFSVEHRAYHSHIPQYFLPDHVEYCGNGQPLFVSSRRSGDLAEGHGEEGEVSTPGELATLRKIVPLRHGIINIIDDTIMID